MIDLIDLITYNKLIDSLQYNPSHEDNDERLNKELKDAWLIKTHYETVEDLTMSKYYDYEVEEPKCTLLDRIKSLIFHTL